MTRPPLPTLDDVAQLAGVSTATISRALNSPGKVAEATRTKINAAIDTLGYTPHFGGQVLASNRTRTVGAVIPTLSNSIFAAGVQAFQERLAETGITLLVASSGYDPEEERRQIRALIGRGADGLLLVGTERPEATQTFLAQRAIPYVLTWCFDPSSQEHFAGFRSYDAAAGLAQQVLDAGHTRIAIIAAHTAQNDRARDRLAGVMDTVAASNSAQVVQVVETDYDITAARTAFTQLMDHQPTVIICANDVIAAGAMAQARAQGLSIPRDISITGFDDIEIASIVDPPLTTLRVPHRAMGLAAADILLGLMAGETVQSAELETEVILRGSLGPPKP